MIAGTITGPSLRVSASAEIGAAAVNVYRMIADYQNGHQRMIPPQYFRNLEVDSGGYGAGTQIRYDLRAFGTTYHARARITEPEPGRVLVETDLAKGAVTTFTVDSLGGRRSLVTISTELPIRSGILGAIQRAMTRRFLRKVYVAELARLDEQVRIG
jgi:Polyketide cyclase / dehydrase and lipid transport